MTDVEYLEEILRDQTLLPEGSELRELRRHRKDVESLLRDAFGEYHPTIRPGGSLAKGTMIKEGYDLDLTCYFPHDETGPGETLKEIYENVESKLAEKYRTQRKSSAIRLLDPTPPAHLDFHIDVVPGRFFDETETDVWLYQTSGKERLKTNLQVHIEHVRNSGVVDAIRLMKLWRVRRQLALKTFALELLVIDLLEDQKTASLPDQLVHVWEAFRDRIEELSIKDPANPEGNDLSELLDDTVRSALATAASETLDDLDRDGWPAVFGPIETQDEEERVRSLKSVAAGISSAPRPWTSGKRDPLA